MALELMEEKRGGGGGLLPYAQQLRPTPSSTPLSPASSLFCRWMHREGAAEGEVDWCSTGARGGEAMRRLKPTALCTTVTARPCPQDLHLGQRWH
uniref:Uncharacterized protein n=1 Tax=Oryza punctata TaxID=4537 RepID=A0A0E0L0Y5_ORYPU